MTGEDARIRKGVILVSYKVQSFNYFDRMENLQRTLLKNDLRRNMSFCYS
jgi:hypothetical protein